MKKEKTALVLGGGGSRGAYEIGVWQALMELDFDIDMVMGTSVGAINGAMVVQNEFDLAVTLWREMETHMIFDLDIENIRASKKTPPIEIAGMSLDQLLAYAKEIIKSGGADTTGLRKILNKYVREDAIRASGLEYGLVTTQLPTFTPHFLYKEDIPEGLMIDYILASSSCFPAVKSHTINGVPYIDGSYADNVPVKMAMHRGASHIIAIDLESFGIVHKEDFEKAPNLHLIKSHWDLGNFLIFNKNNAPRTLRLGYLDAMKTFGVYDGLKFAFPKGELDKKTLASAEDAARIFELDPTVIYKEFMLNKRLAEAVKKQQHMLDRNLKSDLPTLKGRVLETLTLLSKKVNTKTLTLLLAHSLKENPPKNGKVSPPVAKLLHSELAAASYLIKNKII